MNTLLLDTVTWDLVVDNNGNIAMAKEPYALAQDVATACRLFQGELWYDTRQGVPYWQSILGQMPPLAFLRAKYQQAAMTVPDVKTTNIFIASITQDRVVTGQVQITGPSGTIAANFTNIPTVIQPLPIEDFSIRPWSSGFSAGFGPPLEFAP